MGALHLYGRGGHKSAGTIFCRFFCNGLRVVLSGIASTGIIPACINALYKQVGENQSFLATGIAEAGVNVGAFLGTPYIALLEVFGADAVATMLISPVILVGLGVISVRFSR